MGVMKKIRGKLTKAKKYGGGVRGADANTVSSTRRLALEDVTNAGKKNDFPTNMNVKTPGKKKTATKKFRTADVFPKKEKKREEDRASEKTTTTTTTAVLKAVEIFEDDDQFEKRVKAVDSSPGKLRAPPPSLEASSASPSSSSSSSSSKSALEAWADALVGLDKEEGNQPETPTKIDEEKAVVFSSNAAADDPLLPASPIVVSYELSESECGSPMCGGVEGRVLENIDVKGEEEEKEEHVDTLESYLFTPPPVMSKESAKEDAVEEEEEEIDEEKRNTQSARLSLSMWDVNSTSKMINVSFLKNVSAMDVAMGAGVAAVVFNFFMPSFLKASF